ncbi:MAG: murein biosynthesis integral membrane protein MurJ [Candidatus Binatia bacterium]|nr:murein biosynthesis integral membrane protein MurJ [Candidatus Binatia bacterium]
MSTPSGSEEGASERGLARSGAVVGGAVLASRLLGLIREQVFAGFFGAGRELDAFITAFRIPNLFRDLFAEGALSAAFVTTFSQKLEKEGEASAWRLANLVVHALALVVGGIVVLGILCAPQLVDVIAPGFAATPGKTELTVFLTRLLFPFLLLIALAAVAMGMLNAKGRFGVPASASSFFNLGSIVTGLATAWWLAPEYMSELWESGGRSVVSSEAAARAITGMAVGTLIGGALQLLVQVPSLYRVNYRYRPVLSFRDSGLRKVLALMAPATIGAAAVQVNVMVNSNFASTLGDGAVSWLNVAFRFTQLPIGLFGVAIGVVALPAVSRRVAHDDMRGFNDTVTRALGLVFLLTIPSAIGLAVLAPQVIGLVYEYGRFGSHDTAMAAEALVAYSIGLAGYANIKVLVPAFYALGDARTPALVSCLSIAVNATLNWVAIRHFGFGHAALALVTSCVALLNFLVLFVVLTRRMGPAVGLGGVLLRTMLAAAAVALACLATRAGVAALLPLGSVSGRAVAVGACLPVGALVFVWAGARLGLTEITTVLARVGALVRRGSSGGS